MPTVPLVDAHMHLWDTSAHAWYPSLARFVDAGKPEIAQNFLPADYDRGLGAVQVDGLVHVSATTAPHAYLAETRWVDGIADADPRPFAIVGGIDPALPAADLIDHLDQQARSPRQRGVRAVAGLSPHTPAPDTHAGGLQEH
ncbi:hypothetical protein ACFXPR_22625, partial [Nocardia tengchongensis]